MAESKIFSVLVLCILVEREMLVFTLTYFSTCFSVCKYACICVDVGYVPLFIKLCDYMHIYFTLFKACEIKKLCFGI